MILLLFQVTTLAVFSDTATKQDQANIVWDEIAKFIRSDSELEELYKIREHDRTIVSKITGTEIKAIGRDTKKCRRFQISACDRRRVSCS